MIVLLLIAILSFSALSNIFLLERESKPKIIVQKVKRKKAALKKEKISRRLKKDPEIELLRAAIKGLEKPFFFERKINFLPGDRREGVLNSTLISTNLSTIVIDIDEKEFGKTARLICSPGIENKRITGKCTEIVSNRGRIKVDAELRETDDTHGLRGDYYSTKEEFVTANGLQVATNVLLDIAKDRVIDPLSGGLINSSRNTVLDGTKDFLSKNSAMTTQNMKRKIPKMKINKGKRVIIFFNGKEE